MSSQRLHELHKTLNACRYHTWLVLPAPHTNSIQGQSNYCERLYDVACVYGVPRNSLVRAYLSQQWMNDCSRPSPYTRHPDIAQTKYASQPTN